MQSFTNTLSELTLHFADRLASNAMLVGLDDEDEMLLWRFFASFKEKTPAKVIACLKEQAELEAFEISRLNARATISATWVKPQGLLRRSRDMDCLIDILDGPKKIVFTKDKNRILLDATLEAQKTAFGLWYDQLGTITVEGKTREPSSDIISVDIDESIVHLNDELSKY